MITPLGYTIIAKAHAKATMSTGGIFLPTSDPTPVYYHDVISVGRDVKEVKVGDVIYVPAAARRNTIDYEGETFVRVHESEIPFILNNNRNTGFKVMNRTEPYDNGEAITLKQLRDWIAGLSDKYPDGENTEVWIDNGDGTSSPCKAMWPLNVSLNDGVESCDIILGSK